MAKFKFIHEQIVYADNVEEAERIFKKMWDDTHEDFQHQHPTQYFGIIKVDNTNLT